MPHRPPALFDPKIIFVQDKAKDYPLYEELRESFPRADFEVFEGRHDAIPALMEQDPKNFLNAKRDFLILAFRASNPIEPNRNKDASDFMFKGISQGCLFACAYCYTNLHKMHSHKVAPLTLWANIDELLETLVKHQRDHEDRIINDLFYDNDRANLTYDFACNSDPIWEGNFFSSTKKTIEAIAKMDHGYGICTTKATEVDYLLDLDHNNRMTIKIALSPDFVVKKFEIFTGGIAERISAINKLKDAGYNVGITFAPIILRDYWMEDYIELFKYIDEHLTEKAKENLKGDAFFYSHRMELPEKIPMFKKAFDVLYVPEKYPIELKPKEGGVYQYQNLKQPMEWFEQNLKKYLPYFTLRYIHG